MAEALGENRANFITAVIFEFSNSQVPEHFPSSKCLPITEIHWQSSGKTDLSGQSGSFILRVRSSMLVGNVALANFTQENLTTFNFSIAEWDRL